MGKIYRLFVVIVAVCLLSSCSDDIFDGLASSGRKVTLKLRYKESVPREVQVTRTEAATNAENALNNLQVFVFNKQGRLKGYKYIADGLTNLKQNGEIGTVEVKTTSGPSLIYGVANVPTALFAVSQSNANGKMVPTSATEASKKEWKEDSVQNLSSDFTLDDLKTIAFSRGKGEFNITEANFMMSGVVGSDGSCTINADGSLLDNDTIKLRRIVSKNNFTVVEGTGVSFTPTSYEIRNIPTQGQLVDDKDVNVEPSTFETLTGYFSPQNTTSTTVDNDKVYTYSLKDIYLPENRQNDSKHQTPTSWLDREKDNGSTEMDKQFTCAPPNSTYLVLNGTYRGPRSTTDNTEVTGTTKYFVHLGNFGKDVRDFDVDRNCAYNYTIRITGVSSVEAEVTVDQGSQTNGSNEGLVFDLSNGKVYDLDSHYGQIDMEFDQDDVTEEKDENGTTTSYFIFLMVKDPFNETGIIKLSSTNGTDFTLTKGNTNEVVKEDTVTSWFNWVEFKEGSNQSYPGKGDTKLQNLLTVLKDLIKEKIDKGSNTSWSKTYTCFLNENYYEDKNWAEFVNKDQRYMYICRNLTSSYDQRNIKGAVIYGLRQYSIQTFYNTDYGDGGTDDIVAYGVEYIRSDNKTSITDYSKSYTQSGGWSTVNPDSWDGRTNMLRDISNSSTFTDESNQWSNLSYNKAKIACMSRNRDLDGDGKISADEVRWYCPTIAQYAGIWIGEDALADSAKLVTGNSTSIQTKKDDWTYRTAPAIHYYANDNYFYWAEEGMALNKNNGSKDYDNIPFGVRCIRNLKSKDKGTEVAQMYYISDTNNRTIDLKYMNKVSVRTLWQNTELLPHTERGNSLNEPAQKFQYADDLVGGATDKTIYATGTTPCGQKSGGWRAPNQRELCLLYVVGGLDGSYYAGCRTTMANENISYTWGAVNSHFRMYQKSNTDDTYYLRCVKDHDDMK